MSDKLSLQSTIKQSQAVFAQAVDQDLIMLHVNQGKYFASNIVAQQI